MNEKPYLSLVFPAYNEEHRLPRALEQAIGFLQTQPFASEIIVVENGSSDGTLAVAKSFQNRFPALHVFSERSRGKGAAVRAGMLAARGTYRMFLDVDLSMPIEDVVKFIPPRLPDSTHIAIASREGKSSRRIGEPGYRHVMGRVFNLVIRLLILPQYQDSQCGFKCFHEKAAEDLFPLQTIRGWAFDTEVLFIARLRNYAVQEIGIDWYFDPDSRVRVLHDTWQMIKDILLIRRNHHLGMYDRSSITEAN